MVGENQGQIRVGQVAQALVELSLAYLKNIFVKIVD
jgi:hypothetical protein